MKALLALPWAALAAIAFGGCATTRQNTAIDQPARLQVMVNVPPSISVLRDEEIAEAFGYRVAAILHEQGFRGRIRYLDPGETPVADRPLLAVELMEWRVDRGGFVDCTFTAELVRGDTRKRLGLFHGTSVMTWPRRDWYARAEGFEEAARDAVTELAARLEQSGMLDRLGGSR